MARHSIRLYYFSNWATREQDALEYLNGLPARDLSSDVSNPTDPELMKMARLDCDWDGECLRCIGGIEIQGVEILPAHIIDAAGLAKLAVNPSVSKETRWLFFMGQKPLVFGSALRNILEAWTGSGGKVFYWAFDEATRCIPSFAGLLSPYLSIFVHDESPITDEALAGLNPDCIRVHQSWVANILPFKTPFCEEVEEKILFLGSRMGITPARQSQIAALREHYRDRMVAIHDHSVPIDQRPSFRKYKVHFCPEGRKFCTYPMRMTHTDRPFWAGCLGQVPVIEDSRWGGRLESLVQQGLLYRYPHGDVTGLIAACEQALSAGNRQRSTLYTHFNTHETISRVAGRLLTQYYQ